MWLYKSKTFNSFQQELQHIQMLYHCGRIFFFILSFFVGFILSFCLVTLRTIRLGARLGAHIDRRCSRSRGNDVTITDVIIRTPDRKMRLGMWMTSYPEAMGWGFWAIFENKQLVEIWTWTKRVDFRASARPGQLGLRDASRVVGSDGTVSIVEFVCLSLSSCQKTKKVKKIIKVSYLNYRESSVFRVFRDSYACERFTYPYILRIVIMAILHRLYNYTVG